MREGGSVALPAKADNKNYMIRAGDAQSIEPLLSELAQRVPKHGETLMTMAEELLQKGKLTALLEIAQKMLQRGFDSQAIMEVTGLSKDELQQLEQ